jgi:hypothetical protein
LLEPAQLFASVSVVTKGVRQLNTEGFRKFYAFGVVVDYESIGKDTSPSVNGATK